MAINSRISDKIKQLVPENRLLRNKLIGVLNRAEEGKQVSREIKKIMSEIKAD